MKIRLLLFAVLRDIVGKDQIDLTIPEGSTPADVWDMIRRDSSRLHLFERPPMIAVNEEYASPDRRLQEGDEIAFIPPVSGG
jgi:molybdopterin converting factor subunit 1